MNDTTSPPPNPTDSLMNPQTVIALAGVVVAAGALIGVFVIPELTATQAAVISSVISFTLGQVYPFYFGSSRGSQGKDAILAAHNAPRPDTATTVTLPATTTGQNP